MKTAFPQHRVGQLFETFWHVRNLTVEVVLFEDGADERRNASVYESDSVTWCMKDDGLGVCLLKAK